MNGDLIVFQDEVHFYQGTTITRKWALKGSKPQVPSAPGRQSIKYGGYVVSNTGELIVTKPGWFTYETVIESLREFIDKMRHRRRGRRIILVLDNAPWHKKAYRLIETENAPRLRGYPQGIDTGTVTSLFPRPEPYRTMLADCTPGSYAQPIFQDSR